MFVRLQKFLRSPSEGGVAQKDYRRFDRFSMHELRINPDQLAAYEFETDAMFPKSVVEGCYCFGRHLRGTSLSEMVVEYTEAELNDVQALVNSAI